jgi:hypothetical protein
MKHENHTETSRPALAVKTMLSGIAAVALLGFSLNAQAQDCTVGNWADNPVGLSDANTGTQGSDNRRYGGPCGLRVPVDGEPRFLTDATPMSESTYIVRFYVFLNNAGSDDLLIYAADDGEDDVIQIWYDGSDLTLTVFQSDGSTVDLAATGVGSGWHSVEFVWESSDDAEIRFAVNSDDPSADVVETGVDTSGITIANAHLGNVAGIGTAGSGLSMDLDDYDSRRVSRPGRLLRGDATNSGQITTSDVTAVINEVFGGQFAPGQPDCTESGSITTSDVTCVINIVF